MGRLEKVGAAVVGVLLCIIIVVGLLNKNGGKPGPDASREDTRAITPARNGADVPEKGSNAKAGPKVDLRDLIDEEDKAAKAEKDRLDGLRLKGGDAVVKPGPINSGDQVEPILPKPGPEAGGDAVAGAWPKEYEIKSGDILGKICAKEYGTTSMVAAVKAANPGLDPRKLRPGTKISLPAPKAVTKGEAVSAVSEVSSRGSRPSFITPRHIKDNTGAEKLVSVQGGRLYTVKKGDSLSTIAQRELGSVKHIQALIDANKGLIASTRTTLQVGWELAIPNLN